MEKKIKIEKTLECLNEREDIQKLHYLWRNIIEKKCKQHYQQETINT